MDVERGLLKIADDCIARWVIQSLGVLLQCILLVGYYATSVG